MKDLTFGRPAGAEFRIRFYGPCWRWCIAPFRRNQWRAWFRAMPGMNHRCYCQAGMAADGSLVLAGWGFTFWFSRYVGPVPCSCDLVLHEMRHDPAGPLYDPEDCWLEPCPSAARKGAGVEA